MAARIVNSISGMIGNIKSQENLTLASKHILLMIRNTNHMFGCSTKGIKPYVIENAIKLLYDLLNNI